MKTSRIALVAKVAVSTTLMVVLYSRVDIRGLASLLGDMQPLLLIPAAAIIFSNTWISAAKWRVLLKADGITVRQTPLVISYLIATFFNVFLPSNVGGDVYRIYDIGKSTEKPVNTFASVFADRLSGFLALSVLGLVFAIAGMSLIGDYRVLIAPAILFAGVVVVAALLAQRKIIHRLLALTRLDRMKTVRRLNDAFLAAMAAYGARPRVLLSIMAISFCFQFCIIVCVWCLALALRLEIPFFAFCVFVPLISILEAIPISIYGLGLRDAGYVFFFTRLEQPAEHALSLALLYVAVTLIYSSIGGVLFALRAKRRQPREVEE